MSLPAPPEPAKRDRPGRLRPFLLWLAAVVTGGLLLFTYRHLEAVVSGDEESYLRPLINETTAFLGAGLLFFAVVALVRGRPLPGPSLPRRLGLYALALLVYSGLHTSLNWGVRSLLYPLFGLGAFDYGRMPLRYAMELPMDVLAFAMMVGGIHAVAQLRAARQREVERAQLESALARAQLTNLRLQLQPHFLFNTLNTISATMYEDPAAADEMLDHLAELLRASLRTAQTAEVPLAAELELLASYLAIQHGRFGERLVVEQEIPAAALPALVPSMMLQPLVENAIRHGRAEREGQGRVTIRAAVHGEELELSVENDMAVTPDRLPPEAHVTGKSCFTGYADAQATSGIGLSSTAERLALLYGDRHRFAAGPGDDGLYRVRIALPLRRGGSPPA